MPFTLAHPSAVIFLKNKKLNLGGLVLGSMAPDFIYFLLFSPCSNLGHTPIGFIFLNLPLCFLLNFLFYKYIQEIFILTLPSFISKKYLYLIKKKNKITSIKSLVIFSYSCIIGMLTHVFWDAFTHNTGFFVTHLDFLKNKVTLFNHNVTLYKVLQHGSTLIGFLILLFFFYSIRDKRANTYNTSIKRTRLLPYVLLIQAATLILSYLFSIRIEGYFSIGRFVVTFINGLFLGYLFVGMIWQSLTSLKHEKKFR